MRYRIFVFVLASVLVPVIAQAGPFDSPIIPEVCRCAGQAPAYGCVLQVVQNVIRVAIGLGFVLATLALIYAGFVWMTSLGNAEKRSQGKNMLLNVIIGLAIMLGAWLIVDFVMKSVAGNETGGFGPWNNILAGNNESGDRCLQEREPESIVTGSVSVQAIPSGGGGGTPGTGVSTAGTMTHDEARAALTGAGIQIAASTLANTRRDTINQAIAIRQACGCSVTVTSTTGGSHQSGTHSHANGYKIDLDDNAALDRFLYGALTRSGTRSGANGGPRYLDRCGNEYVRETSRTHWDITVNHGVCSLSGS